MDNNNSPSPVTMAKPELLRYSNKRCWAPTVVSVDDAWFEGTRHERPVFELFDLGGVHDAPLPLTTLVERIRNKPSRQDADALYLLNLAEECEARGFALALCNFEGLESDWARLNSAGNAILIDLNYTLAPDGEYVRNYGLRLIHRLLNGGRPSADIFVVTGAPTEFYSELKAQAETDKYHTWWPIRSLPVVTKANGKSRARDINCFAEYFSQGNRSSPVADLLRSLVWARNAGYKWSHPDSFSDVPRDLMLYSLFESDCDSVKALFHNKSGPYPIRKSVFLTLLRCSGHIISCDDSLPDTIVLPRRPFGAIWVAQLVDLLVLMLRHADLHSTANLRHSGTYCILEIPLNQKYANEFIEAVNGTRVKMKGRTTEAYEALQRHEIRQEMRYELSEADRDVLCQSILNSKKTSVPNYSVTIKDVAHIVVTWEGIYK